MAKEYIEREAALNCLKIARGYCPCAYEGISNLPAADVAPVRHGRLVSTGYVELYCEFGDCTICGADNPISNRYCGQCGAKMDLEG